jgi:hypothetical protein
MGFLPMKKVNSLQFIRIPYGLPTYTLKAHSVIPSVEGATERADHAEIDHLPPPLASSAVPILVGPFHEQGAAVLADCGAFQVLDDFDLG